MDLYNVQQKLADLLTELEEDDTCGITIDMLQRQPQTLITQTVSEESAYLHRLYTRH